MATEDDDEDELSHEESEQQTRDANSLDLPDPVQDWSLADGIEDWGDDAYFKDPRVVSFLEAMATGATPTRAARIAQGPNKFFYALRRKHDAFRLAWDDAVDQGLDLLEEEARRRAVEGVATPIYDNKGRLKGTKIEYSDTLLVLMLKAGRPNKFRESFRAEISDPDGKAFGSGAIENAAEKITAALNAIIDAKERQEQLDAPKMIEGETHDA